MNFWVKFNELSRSRGEAPTKAAVNMGITKGSVTKYKNGVIPTGETLLKVAEYFDVSMDYLISDIETDINIQSKRKEFCSEAINVSTSMFSLHNRFDSLHSISKLSNEMITSIAEFTNCSYDYFVSADFDEYKPLSKSFEVKKDSLVMLEYILGLMDKCAGSNDVRNIQIHLSHIVLYHVQEKDTKMYDYDYCCKLLSALQEPKLSFIFHYGNKEDTFDSYNSKAKFGFNLSDLYIIREVTGLSFLQLFTGKDYADISI